jgi:hypothetical protein
MSALRRQGIGVLAACVVIVSVRPAPAAVAPRDLLDTRRQLYATTYAWSDQHQVLRVTTVDAAAHAQERTIELFERRYGDGARTALLVFLEPDNVKGMAVLSQARPGAGEPERWLYLPRQKRARRFAGQMKDEGMMGTDLTAAELDLMGETLEWTAAAVRPTLRGPERCEDVETYGFEVAEVRGYARVVLWIGTRDLVMRQLELWGPDAVLKRIRQSEVRFVGAVPLPARVEVENPQAGTRSVFEVVEAQFDRGFPDDVFSLPLLATPNKE